jgi:purine-binding chemotaxis protein CheW
MNSTENRTSNEYLVFSLKGERYALPVEEVREVLDLRKITRIPGAPSYMRGIINVRGAVVPVVDLRMKFDSGIMEADDDTQSIIVLDLSKRGLSASLGILTDTVDAVLHIGEEMIDQPPQIGGSGGSGDANYFKGIGKLEDSFVMILDTGKMFSAEDLVYGSDPASV